MKLSLATFVTLGALIFPGTVAQLTADQVVAAINLVANIFQNSNDALSPLSTSPATQVRTASQTRVNNFNMVISNATDRFLHYPQFVAVHQAFLSTVIGKIIGGCVDRPQDPNAAISADQMALDFALDIVAHTNVEPKNWSARAYIAEHT
ncbi:hypothetical protein MVEN_00871700 [Mycena venus]|uniref:Uncharacterized protein n=1 Tax=Mycena venus TaxID=2733690 RepID=A0A8H6YFV3_9AGAR|nr:hypothetical protein MVEN_00871700 [Mycena venus]